MQKQNRWILYLLIPEFIVVSLFLLAWVISPPGSGRDLSLKAGLPEKAVMAHRGASYHAPEETIAAYKIALQYHPDYLEGDVQRTKDGVLVLFHDDTLERTTDITTVFPERKDFTLDKLTFAELQRLDAGSWFNSKFPERQKPGYVGLKIIRLVDLLDLVDKSAFRPGLYLETKSPERYPGIETQIIQLLQNRGWLTPNLYAPLTTRAGVVVQSFDLESIKKFRTLAPQVPRVYLLSQEMETEKGWDTLLEEAASVEAHIGPSGYQAFPWFIAPAHKKGLIVHPYTINAGWQMFLINQFGSDGMFSDKAEELMEFYGRSSGITIEEAIRNAGY